MATCRLTLYCINVYTYFINDGNLYRTDIGENIASVLLLKIMCLSCELQFYDVASLHPNYGQRGILMYRLLL